MVETTKKTPESQTAEKKKESDSKTEQPVKLAETAAVTGGENTKEAAGKKMGIGKRIAHGLKNTLYFPFRTAANLTFIADKNLAKRAFYRQKIAEQIMVEGNKEAQQSLDDTGKGNILHVAGNVATLPVRYIAKVVEPTAKLLGQTLKGGADVVNAGVWQPIKGIGKQFSAIAKGKRTDEYEFPDVDSEGNRKQMEKSTGHWLSKPFRAIGSALGKSSFLNRFDKKEMSLGGDRGVLGKNYKGFGGKFGNRVTNVVGVAPRILSSTHNFVVKDLGNLGARATTRFAGIGYNFSTGIKNTWGSFRKPRKLKHKIANSVMLVPKTLGVLGKGLWDGARETVKSVVGVGHATALRGRNMLKSVGYAFTGKSRAEFKKDSIDLEKRRHTKVPPVEQNTYFTEDKWFRGVQPGAAKQDTNEEKKEEPKKEEKKSGSETPEQKKEEPISKDTKEVQGNGGNTGTQETTSPSETSQETPQPSGPTEPEPGPAKNEKKELTEAEHKSIAEIIAKKPNAVFFRDKDGNIETLEPDFATDEEGLKGPETVDMMKRDTHKKNMEKILAGKEEKMKQRIDTLEKKSTEGTILLPIQPGGSPHIGMHQKDANEAYIHFMRTKVHPAMKALAEKNKDTIIQYPIDFASAKDSAKESEKKKSKKVETIETLLGDNPKYIQKKPTGIEIQFSDCPPDIQKKVLDEYPEMGKLQKETEQIVLNNTEVQKEIHITQEDIQLKNIFIHPETGAIKSFVHSCKKTDSDKRKVEFSSTIQENGGTHITRDREYPDGHCDAKELTEKSNGAKEKITENKKEIPYYKKAEELITEQGGKLDSICYPGCGDDITPAKAFAKEKVLFIDKEKFQTEKLAKEGYTTKNIEISEATKSDIGEHDLVIAARTQVQTTLIKDMAKKGGYILAENAHNYGTKLFEDPNFEFVECVSDKSIHTKKLEELKKSGQKSGISTGDTHRYLFKKK